MIHPSVIPAINTRIRVRARARHPRRARSLRARWSVAGNRARSRGESPRRAAPAGRYYGYWKRARIYLVSVPYAGLPVARLKCELQPPVEFT